MVQCGLVGCTRRSSNSRANHPGHRRPSLWSVGAVVIRSPNASMSGTIARLGLLLEISVGVWLTASTRRGVWLNVQFVLPCCRPSQFGA